MQDMQLKEAFYVHLRNVFIVLSVTLISFLLWTSNTNAMGVSPPILYFENVPAGGTITKTVNLSRGEATKPTAYEIEFTKNVGDGALSGPERIEVPAGERSVKYPVTVNAGSLPAGEYTGRFMAVEVADAEVLGKGAGSIVVTGVEVEVLFSITNDSVKSYEVFSVDTKSTEEMQPVILSYGLKNTGNVDARPARVVVNISDAKTGEKVHEETIATDKLTFVKAFKTEETRVATKAELSEGLYTLSARFYSDDSELKFEKRDIPFQVFPPGTLEQEGKLLTFYSDKSLYQLGELVEFGGEFENMGEVSVSCTLVVDVYKDGQRIEVLNGDETYVPPGQTADFTLEHKFTEGGEYEVKAYVKYGIAKTAPLKIKVNVETASSLAIVAMLVVITLIVIGVVMFILKRKRSHLTQLSQTANQVVAPPHQQGVEPTTQATKVEGDTQNPNIPIPPPEAPVQ